MAMSRRAKLSRSAARSVSTSASCGASTAAKAGCGSSPPDASPSSGWSRASGVLRAAGSAMRFASAPPPEASPLLP
jgi:hypothetical protein